MSDHGILFSAPMVRALLAGRKTQTRRPLYALRKGDFKRQMRAVESVNYPPPSLSLADAMDHFYDLRRMYAVGDRLWVREAWAPLDALTHNDPGVQALADRGFYRADNSTVEGEITRWRPSIHMPRWASRLTLTVTDVRVQRLQDISEEDARAEGAYVAVASKRVADNYATMAIGGVWFSTARRWYADLWDRINGEGAWQANPFVVAYSFTVERRNIDA